MIFFFTPLSFLLPERAAGTRALQLCSCSSLRTAKYLEGFPRPSAAALKKKQQLASQLLRVLPSPRCCRRPPAAAAAVFADELRSRF